MSLYHVENSQDDPPCFESPTLLDGEKDIYPETNSNIFPAHKY